MTKEPKIPVIEMFGPTIQGEGLMTGTVTHFLRTGGCGLRCYWCDSLHAVLPKEVKRNRTMMTTGEILQGILGKPYAPYLTLTGGDPCLHQHLGDIIPKLNQEGMRVAVETQGELFPDWLGVCDVITFSPKPPSSRNIVEPDELTKWLIKNQPSHFRVCIKIVVFSEDDFEYALRVYKFIPEHLYDAFYFTAGTPAPLAPPSLNDEEAADPQEVERKVVGALNNQRLLANLLIAEARTQKTLFNDKVHVGHQQHVILWPDKEIGV